MSGLSSLGWDERAARAVAEICAPGCAAGRVVRVDLDSVVVATEGGDRRARARELPTVGDWVAADVQEQDAVVVGVARRWSELSRRDPTGRTQVLAANVDLVLVTAPADRLSVARVEREVAMGWDSGARPVVLLTKSDLAPTGLFEELRFPLGGCRGCAGEHRDRCGSPRRCRDASSGPHGGPARTLRGRQVLVGQPAARAWGSAHGTGPSRRSSGSARDQQSGPVRRTHRWRDHRYPRATKPLPDHRPRRGDGGLPGHRGPRDPMSVRGLPTRARAGLCPSYRRA